MYSVPYQFSYAVVSVNVRPSLDSEVDDHVERPCCELVIIGSKSKLISGDNIIVAVDIPLNTRMRFLYTNTRNGSSVNVYVVLLFRGAVSDKSETINVFTLFNRLLKKFNYRCPQAHRERFVRGLASLSTR